VTFGIQFFSFNIAHLDDTATYKVKDCLFTVVDVDRVIKNCLKLGKAAGSNNVSAEHIIYAHPSIVMHLCNLFRPNLIVKHAWLCTSKIWCWHYYYASRSKIAFGDNSTFDN